MFSSSMWKFPLLVLVVFLTSALVIVLFAARRALLSTQSDLGELARRLASLEKGISDSDLTDTVLSRRINELSALVNSLHQVSPKDHTPPMAEIGEVSQSAIDSSAEEAETDHPSSGDQTPVGEESLTIAPPAYRPFVSEDELTDLEKRYLDETDVLIPEAFLIRGRDGQLGMMSIAIDGKWVIPNDENREAIGALSAEIVECDAERRRLSRVAEERDAWIQFEDLADAKAYARSLGKAGRLRMAPDGISVLDTTSIDEELAARSAVIDQMKEDLGVTMTTMAFFQIEEYYAQRRSSQDVR